MKRQMKKLTAVLMAAVLTFSCTSCGKPKKEPKPTPKAMARVDEGNANATGQGDNVADIPIIIASTKFSKEFNPFVASDGADRQAVDLTQIRLVENDRAGRLVYKGIDGELRQYGEESYTYYGASDLSIDYNKKSDTTTYQIVLRNDLVFSNGEKLTIDDVLFSIYAFCDNDYKGERNLKNMPIRGLVNYQANSTKADKYPSKKVAKYIKKNPKKLKKWIKKNITHKGLKGEKADYLIERQARIFMSQGNGKKVKSISGIKRINDYEMTIVTDGYTREMSQELQIPVCALHYYGDTSKYNVEKGQFGFKRGDISSICANKTAPMGAGAYRFIKYEDGIVYYTSNELYFLGCPKIAYLQLKDMTDTLEKTRTMLKEKAQETGQQEVTATGEDKLGQGEQINMLAEVTEMKGGVIDVISGKFDGEQLYWISKENSNGELSGKTIYTQPVGDGNYYYIGINGQNVSVEKSAGSEASKNLRKAFATVFSACRDVLKEKGADIVRIVNYPAASESWVSPSEEDDNYSVAYGKDASGQEIEEENSEEKISHAVQAALQYLEKAGYQTENGKVTAAPKGAALKYSVWYADGQEALYDVMERAAQELGKIGIALEIKNVGSEDILQKKLGKNRQQIWIGRRDIKDTDFSTRYSSANHPNCFGISDKKLNRLVKKMDRMLTSSARKRVYQKSFKQVLDWAVEVPVCEFNTLLLFSSKRIDSDTIPADSTPYYNWINEIQKVEMK